MKIIKFIEGFPDQALCKTYLCSSYRTTNYSEDKQRKSKKRAM